MAANGEGCEEVKQMMRGLESLTKDLFANVGGCEHGSNR